MRFSCLVLFVSLFAAGALADAAPRLILATEENPPANFTDPVTGALVGVAHEKVGLMMERAGLDYEVRQLPWTEAFALAETNEAACVYLTNRTPEREPLFQWVSPLMTGGWALFARANWDGRLDTIQDLRGLRVAVQQASAVEAHLEGLSDQVGGLVLDPRVGFGNLKRLEQGEIDLYAAGIWSGSFQARKERVPVRMVYRLSTSIGALACNKGMDPDIVSRMQTALNSLIADGTADAIDQRYDRPAGWSRGLVD